MVKGNHRNGRLVGFGGDLGKKYSSSSSVECDVGLGLKMQSTESSTSDSSFPCKGMMMVMPHHPPPPPPQFHGGSGGGCSGFSGGGSPFDIYNAFGSPPPPFKSSETGEVAFTVNQWQELQRQTMIYKYMMASVPVPPELLIPISKSPSQSNRLNLPVLSTTRSDAEPWRCKRTDGKKWRCSRDVVPDLKYCERHAHKSKARSRKLVEIQSHNNSIVNGFSHHPPPPTRTSIQFDGDNIQKPVSNLSDLVSGYGVPLYDQRLRYNERFMKDTTNFIPSDQQWHQSLPGRTGSKPDPFIQNQDLNDPFFSLKCGLNDGTTQTRHFFDAFSGSEIDNKSSKNEFPISSLRLSMYGQDEVEGEGDCAQTEGNLGIKSNWLNPVSWVDSPPGGPLGEALCLGISGSVKAVSGDPSPVGCSSTTTTTTSSCSKSSCEDASHGLNFY